MHILGDCDFEKHSFCEWLQVNDGRDDFDWLINQGKTLSKDTGPTVDHTTHSKQGITSLVFYTRVKLYTTSPLFDDVLPTTNQEALRSVAFRSKSCELPTRNLKLKEYFYNNE